MDGVQDEAGMESGTPLPRGPAALRAPLFQHGPEALSLGELIQLVSGAPDAASGISAAGGLRALAQGDPREACDVAGLPRARGARILAALELGRRAQQPSETRPRLRTPAEIFRHVWPSLGLLGREVFHVLCFNPRNVLLADVRIAEGTVDSCQVDPRDVFRVALASRATALVLVHNHPSGDPEPSVLDVTLTRQLVHGADLLGLKVLDHLVVGDGDYSSMLERGSLGPIEREARALSWQDARRAPTPVGLD